MAGLDEIGHKNPGHVIGRMLYIKIELSFRSRAAAVGIRLLKGITDCHAPSVLAMTP